MREGELRHLARLEGGEGRFDEKVDRKGQGIGRKGSEDTDEDTREQGLQLEQRKDVFLPCSQGTKKADFLLPFQDAVHRQDGGHGAGDKQGDDREDDQDQGDHVDDIPDIGKHRAPVEIRVEDLLAIAGSMKGGIGLDFVEGIQTKEQFVPQGKALRKDRDRIDERVGVDIG